MELWELVAREESVRDLHRPPTTANGDSGRIDPDGRGVFAPDGIMETGSGRYVGREAIHAFMSSVADRGPARRQDDSEESVVMTPTQEWLARRGRMPFISATFTATHADRRVERDARAEGALVLPSSSRCTASTTGAGTSTSFAPVRRESG